MVGRIDNSWELHQQSSPEISPSSVYRILKVESWAFRSDPQAQIAQNRPCICGVRKAETTPDCGIWTLKHKG